MFPSCCARCWRRGAGRRAPGSTARSAPAAMPAACWRPARRQVIGIDRDPLALEMAADWAGRLRRPAGAGAGPVFAARRCWPANRWTGVVLDLGVSSMQLDRAERGFSFLRDGPLDMRMSQAGPDAPPIWSTAPPRRSWPTSSTTTAKSAPRAGSPAHRRGARRRAARDNRCSSPQIVENCLPRPKPGQSHPATRSFQAIRIAVNDEFGELVAGLEAAERALKPGGRLAVVTFHSLEDRIVKRFFQLRSGARGRGQPPCARGARGRAALRPADPPRRRRRTTTEIGRQPARALGQAAGRGAHRRRPPAPSTARALGLPHDRLKGSS